MANVLSSDLKKARYFLSLNDLQYLLNLLGGTCKYKGASYTL